MDYLQNALEITNKLGVEMTCAFLKHDFHFQGDKEKRDIYEITLKRGGKQFSFNFGQSINNSCEPIEQKQKDVLNTIDVFAGFKLKDVNAGIKFKINKNNDWFFDLVSLREQLEKDWLSNYKTINKYYKDKYDSGKISKNFYLSKINVNSKDLEGICHQIITSAVARELTKIIFVNRETKNKIEPDMYDIIGCIQKYDVGTFDDFCSEFGYDNDSISALKTYKAVKEQYTNMCMLFTETELELLSEIQ